MSRGFTYRYHGGMFQLAFHRNCKKTISNGVGTSSHSQLTLLAKLLIRNLRHSRYRDQAQVELLEQVLENAEVTESARFPRNAIKMNSRFRVLDLGTGKKQVYTLVYPDEANVSSGSISVLAPIGISLLGRRQGTTIEVDVPGRIRRLRIERVLYPPDRFRKRLRSQAGTIVAMSSAQDFDSLSFAA